MACRPEVLGLVDDYLIAELKVDLNFRAYYP